MSGISFKPFGSGTIVSALDRATDKVATSAERLSSGLRINRASDDAAGLAIAADLNASRRIGLQGVRNFNDGISVLSMTQSALQALGDINSRQQELASQAANGSFNLTQRLAMQQESDALTNEFNRIIQTTKFNGTTLLDLSQTSLTLQGGVGLDGSIKFNLGSELDRLKGTRLLSTTVDATVANNMGVAAFDVNGDGFADVISPNGTVYYGSSTGALSAGSSVFSGVDEIQFVDVNGDGRPDYVGHTTNAIVVQLNNGNGTFATAISTAATGFGGASLGMTVGDFNGDGIQDVALSNSSASNNVQIMHGNGSGGFSAGMSFTVGTGSVDAMASGDINGDGVLDILTYRSGGTFLSLGTGGGTFATAVLIAGGSGGSLGEVAIGDFNRDGYEDVALTQGGFLIIFNGNASGTLVETTSFALGGSGNGEIVLGDFDADGYLDILTAGYGTTARAYFGNGAGGFTNRNYTGNAVFTAGVAAGDFNGDGVTDFFSVNSGTGAGRVYLQNTSATTEVQYTNILSVKDARTSLTMLQSQATRISLEQGTIGASQSRLEVAVRNLQSATIEKAAAHDRITSVDVAEESAKLVAASIQQNIVAALAAQAKQTNLLVLKLLN